MPRKTAPDEREHPQEAAASMRPRPDAAENCRHVGGRLALDLLQ